jgi:hypothetical protein
MDVAPAAPGQRALGQELQILEIENDNNQGREFQFGLAFL